MFRRSAFTLIELLIVVAIIGILVAIALPNFQNAMVRTKIAGTYQRMNTVHNAISGYMLDNRQHPPEEYGDSIITPWVFATLTTPISYLSSVEVCRDYFRRYLYMPETIDYYGPVPFYFGYDAHFNVFQSVRNENDSKNLIENGTGRAYEKGIRYILVSDGPSRSGAGLFQGIQLYSKYHQDFMDHVYSSSNGLISSGEIVSTNVGTFR